MLCLIISKQQVGMRVFILDDIHAFLRINFKKILVYDIIFLQFHTITYKSFVSTYLLIKMLWLDVKRWR